jgi:hypothetical protein
VEFTKLQDFEKAINAYIDGQVNTQAYFHGEIRERKLVVSQHNTWQEFGSKAVMMLSKDFSGAILPNGMLQLLDFIDHELNALVFTVVYKGKSKSLIV